MRNEGIACGDDFSIFSDTLIYFQYITKRGNYNDKSYEYFL